MDTSSAPFFVFNHCRCGRVAIFVSGNVVSYSLFDQEHPSLTEIGTVEGKVLSVVATSAVRIVMMTTVTAIFFTVDLQTAAVSMLGELPEFPVLRFGDMSVMTLTCPVCGSRLSGDYDVRSTSLDADDTRDLTADLLSAYEDLSTLAAGSGYFLQPVLARYRYVDAAGATLFVSPVTMVCAPTGFQCTGRREVAFAEGFGRRQQGKMSADVYRIVLSGSRGNLSGKWAAQIDRLVVELSAPLHPVDFSGRAATSIVRTGTDSASIGYCLPGTSVGMAGSVERLRATVAAVADAGDEAFSVVAVLARPFAGKEVSLNVGPPQTMLGSVKRQAAALQRLISSPKSAFADCVASRCRLPHRFSAAVAAVAGGSVIWGDLTLRRFEGYPAECFALGDTEDLPWKAAVTVTMASGEERVVMASSGDRHAPVALSPMLSYPSADAVEMTVAVSRGGVLYRHSFPLTALPGGSCAIYLDQSLKPVVLEAVTGEFVVPASFPSSEELPSAVVTASAVDPLNAVSASSVPPGRVTAVETAPVAGALWDSGRLRVYLMTDAGIMLGRHSTSGFSDIRRIDSRGVASSSCVTVTTDRSMPVVAVAGNDLVSVNGSRVTTVLLGVDAVMAGWDSVNADLWLACGDGTVTVVPACGDRFRLSSVNVRSLVTTSTGLLAATSSGLRDTSRGAGKDPVDVMLQYEVSLEETVVSGRRLRIPALSPWRVCEASVDLASVSAQIGISFFSSDAPAPWPADGADGYVHPVAGCRLTGADYRISGSVVGSLRLTRLNLVPRRRLTLLLRGKLDCAAHIGGVTLVLVSRR